MVSEGKLECMLMREMTNINYGLGSVAAAETVTCFMNSGICILCSNSSYFPAQRLGDSSLNSGHEGTDLSSARVDYCHPASLSLSLSSEFSHILGRILGGPKLTSWSVTPSGGHVLSALKWLWCHRCWESSLSTHACIAHSRRKLHSWGQLLTTGGESKRLVLQSEALWVNILGDDLYTSHEVLEYFSFYCSCQQLE